MIVGGDLFVRILDPKYYDVDIIKIRDKFKSKNIKFLVFKRYDIKSKILYDKIFFEKFKDWSEMYEFVDDFRIDISSTEIRNKK